jgi:putative polyketide hydroxylase
VETCSVLVVGVGPVGLSLALALHQHGVSCLLVERHGSTLDFPKGRGVTVRTMEIFRRWGLAEAVERVGLSRGESLYVFSGESLLAEDFHRVGMPPGPLPASPTERLMCDQMAMETVLLQHVVERGVEVRHRTEMTELAPDDTGVTVSLTARATGVTSQLRTDWVVAADGVRSGVRNALGITRSGHGRHGSAVSIFFDAHVGPRLAGRTAALYRTSGAPGATLLAVDNADRWLIIQDVDPMSEPAETFTEQWAAQLATRVIGDPSVPVRVHGVRPWESATLVADQFRAGRVFLVGDAAHVTTPVGGLGMNCGIADVDNLAWKLAAVIDGWGHASLLDSYEAERRPVAVATTEASLGAARPPAVGRGISLGYAYASAVIVPDGTEAPQLGDPVNDYIPTARPGHRAPHVWLDEGASLSTLDLVGPWFLVLTTAGRAAAETALVEGRARGLPLRVEVVDSPAFLAAYGLAPGAAVLVRPDGHVAWRGVPGPALGDALHRAVGLPGVPTPVG